MPAFFDVRAATLQAEQYRCSRLLDDRRRDPHSVPPPERGGHTHQPGRARPRFVSSSRRSRWSD